MKYRPVEMFEIRIPVDAIRRLTEEQRFAYYSLGHMFNELMCLQKLVGFALPKNDDVRPARRVPELGQAAFLFRMACSKIWEIKLGLDAKEIARTLHADVLPRMESGPARRKSLNQLISEAKWLAPLRNELGFHAPTFDEWRAITTPTEEWVDDVIYLGDKNGNTFYEASENIAQQWMKNTCTVPTDRLVSLIDQMIGLLQEMNDYLADVLGVFIAEVILAEPSSPRLIGKVLAPDFESFSLPFWTTLAKRPAAV